jgi:Circularly permutated YpsA SLOG family
VAIEKIVCGGQTGADRGALHAAQALGVPIGGWVPRGRRAEDGPIARDVGAFNETSSDDPHERTRLNVRDSDGTLIVSHGPLVGGSAYTLQIAKQLHKPVCHIDLDRVSVTDAIPKVRAWLHESAIQCLNVAGPRASEDARAYEGTFAVVSALLVSEVRLTPRQQRC